jgi:MFS family permease
MFQRINRFGATLKRSVLYLATGGAWAHSQPAETRRNLIWFWFDGLFASASDNIIVTYLVVYLLTLGATQTQIGIFSSLSSLTAALVLLPGAWLVERLGKRRPIVLFCGSWSRSALLLLALAPFFLKGPALVSIAMLISISRDAMGNLSYPAWMALTADVVPIEGRGRYFASRNFIMSVMGIVVTFLVGLLITNAAGLRGYQMALALAFLTGLSAVFSFGHMRDPAPAALQEIRSKERVPAVENLRKSVSGLLAHRDFALFVLITALWNISLNVAGPFFNVYLVQNLQANPTMIGLTSIASSVAGMLVQYKLGELNDRWGARKLTVISGLLIPIVPLAWMFIDSAWYVIPINLVSGALWGAYGMGSFNYLLQITPADQRARYSAVFQMVVTLSLAVGAALGSLLVSLWSIPLLFGISAFGRLATALLFAWLLTRAGKRADVSTVQAR